MSWINNNNLYGAIKGHKYERQTILFIAAYLSRCPEVKDFCIMGYPKDNDTIEDITLKIEYGEPNTNKVFFIQVKHLEGQGNSEVKLAMSLEEYSNAFEKIKETKGGAFHEYFKDIPVENYSACFFTNATQLTTKQEKAIETVQKELEQSGLKFLNATNESDYKYKQIRPHSKNVKNQGNYENFLDSFFIFTDQPGVGQIRESTRRVLGSAFSQWHIATIEDLIETLMERDGYCVPLTKVTFETICFKVLCNEWTECNTKNIRTIRKQYFGLWMEIFSNCNDNIVTIDGSFAHFALPLLANYYECYISSSLADAGNKGNGDSDYTLFNWQESIDARKQADRDQLSELIRQRVERKYDANVFSLDELLVLLWEKENIPLIIRQEKYEEFIHVFKHYKYLGKKFILILNNEADASQTKLFGNVSSSLLQSAMDQIKQIPLSLQGRPETNLYKIMLENTEILNSVTTSRLLHWTAEVGVSNFANLANILKKPNEYYIARRFLVESRETCSESELLAKPHGIYFITGESGMGKSTVLASLAYQYDPNNFLIFCDLSKYVYELDNENCSVYSSEPLDYFLDKMLDDDDDDQIIREIYAEHKNSGRLALFLDSFDVLKPNTAEKVLQLMEVTLKSVQIKVYLTTRMERNQSSMIIKPLDDDEIASYCTNLKIPQTVTTKLTGVALFRNPHYLNMLAEICKNTASASSMTISDLYKTFIELKRIAYTVKQKMDANNVEFSFSPLLHIFEKDIITSIQEKEPRLLNFLTILLEYGVDLNTLDDNTENPLHLGAEKGNEPVVELLLNKCTNPIEVIEQCDQFGNTPIHCAAKSGNEKILRLLLNKNSKPIKEQNNCGENALHIAVQKGDLNSVKLLLEHGLELSTLNNLRQTPLHLCANNESVVKLFLNKCTNAMEAIEQCDRFGNTPIHRAAESGNETVLRLLLNKNAKPVKKRNNDGLNALHLADSWGYLDAKKLLLKYGLDE